MAQYAGGGPASADASEPLDVPPEDPLDELPEEPLDDLPDELPDEPPDPDPDADPLDEPPDPSEGADGDPPLHPTAVVIAVDSAMTPKLAMAVRAAVPIMRVSSRLAGSNRHARPRMPSDRSIGIWPISKCAQVGSARSHFDAERAQHRRFLRLSGGP